MGYLRNNGVALVVLNTRGQKTRLFVTGSYQVASAAHAWAAVAMTSQRLYWLTPAPSREV